MKLRLFGLAIAGAVLTVCSSAFAQGDIPGEVAKAPHEDSGYWLLIELSTLEAEAFVANGTSGSGGGSKLLQRFRESGKQIELPHTAFLAANGEGGSSGGPAALVLNEDDLRHFPRKMWPYIRTTDLAGLFGSMTAAQQLAIGINGFGANSEVGYVVSEEELKKFPRWMWPYIRASDLGGLFHAMTEAQRFQLGVVDFKDSQFSKSLALQQSIQMQAQAQALYPRGSSVGMFVDGTPLEDIPFDILTKAMGRPFILIQQE